MHSKMLFQTIATLSFLLLGSVGCISSSKPWEVVHPASGTIEFKGKPVENAEITFFPTDSSVPDSVRPKGKSTADGKFVLGTYSQSDGAPAGKYKVTVIRNEVSISKDTIVAKPNDLPVKYSALNTTDLVIEIAAGTNEIPTIKLN